MSFDQRPQLAAGGGLDKRVVQERMARGLAPASAHEYLLRVKLESESLPDVVEADVPARFVAPQTVYQPIVEELAPCPPHLEVSREWQRHMLADFVEVRQYLRRWKARGGKPGGQPPEGSAADARVPVPALKDELGWHIFCLGCAEGKEPATKIEGRKMGHEWAEEYPRGCSPTMPLLFQFDRVLTNRLLEFQASWLKNKVLSRARGVWIYSLLALLDKPLIRDSAAVVRELLRRVCAQRAEIVDVDDKRLPTLGMLAAITGQFFEQTNTAT